MNYLLAVYIVVMGTVVAYRILLATECNSLRNSLNEQKK